MKFQFRYETLLRHRRDREDQCQRELAAQLRTRMVLTDQLRSTQSNISASKRDLGEALAGRVDLSRVGEFTRFNSGAEARGRQIVQRLAEMQGRIEAARQRLLEATQQRKALDVLRDRDYAQWKRQEARRETAEHDELAAQAFIRGNLEGVA